MFEPKYYVQRGDNTTYSDTGKFVFNSEVRNAIIYRI